MEEECNDVTVKLTFDPWNIKCDDFIFTLLSGISLKSSHIWERCEATRNLTSDPRKPKITEFTGTDGRTDNNGRNEPQRLLPPGPLRLQLVVWPLVRIQNAYCTGSRSSAGCLQVTSDAAAAAAVRLFVYPLTNSDGRNIFLQIPALCPLAARSSSRLYLSERNEKQ